MGNARKVNGEINVFSNFEGSQYFIGLTALIILIQVVMVQTNPFGFFKTETLTLVQYVFCVVIGATELCVGVTPPIIGPAFREILGKCMCIQNAINSVLYCFIRTFYENGQEIVPEADDETGFTDNSANDRMTLFEKVEDDPTDEDSQDEDDASLYV